MRLHHLLALLAAVAVLAAGAAYVTERPRSWSSDAQVVLVPATLPKGEASPLDSFSSGGTLGTTVELLSSPDLAAQVPQRGVAFTARAVTDSRVIALHATGPQAAVQPALAALLVQAAPAQARLADRWTLVALTRPTTAALAGPPASALFVAAGLLALLTFTAVLVGTGRLVPGLATHRLRVRLPRRPETRRRDGRRGPALGTVPGGGAVAEPRQPDR